MTDAELLTAWRGGDRLAGEQLFERHFDAVARFFRNKVNHEVEDLIQRTFLACVEGRDRFRGDASFRTYLFAVAHNLLSKHFRSKRRHADRIDFNVTSVYDLSPSPSTIVAVHQEQQLLVDALRRIPIDAQVVLELYYWERMTAAEVGAVVGVPEGTARTRIRRAKQLLEARMSETISSQGRRLMLADVDRWAESLRDPAAGKPHPQ